jgi:hypothetical protein
MATAIAVAIRTVSGNQPVVKRIIEKAAQTFVQGAVVAIETATGSVIEWNGTVAAASIAGVASEPAGNLATTGVPKQLTFGSVPNQAAAVKIARPPFNDGRNGFYAANPADTVFSGQVGPAQTTAVTDVGKQYGMTKDSDGHWYVDKTKSTVGTNTVVTVVKLDYWDTVRGVHFMFLPTYAQVFA